MAYRNPGRIIRCEGEPGTEVEGFWIDIRQVRYGDAVQALLNNTYWLDLLEVMAPFVVGWNLEGEIFEQVEKPAVGTAVPERTSYGVRYGPIPPPAEAGAEVFAKLPQDAWQWILEQLHRSVFYREGDPGKDESSSEPMPDGEPSEIAASTTKRRRSRKSSPQPSLATSAH